jgi:hypothetical protein
MVIIDESNMDNRCPVHGVWMLPTGHMKHLLMSKHICNIFVTLTNLDYQKYRTSIPSMYLPRLQAARLQYGPLPSIGMLPSKYLLRYILTVSGRAHYRRLCAAWLQYSPLPGMFHLEPICFIV